MSKDKSQDARQYLAGETGIIIKDWGGRLPFALVYPNSYYVGMSNLGIQAIYGLLNNRPDAVCERVFIEKEDWKLRVKPLSVESQRPLTDFAVVAFSISYELDYFNVVRALKDSGIPLYSKDRDETHPLVIAGGPCITSNPMPLASFFDCLCVGEAEAILPAMISTIKDSISGSREQLLEKLARQPGVYVPRAGSEKTVVRQWVKNLDDFPTHSAVLTHDTELGDLYMIEVERGCSWGCRFCMVSTAFSPVRYRSVNSLLGQAKEGLNHRRRLGLVGPAVGDHPHFEELVEGLHGMGAGLSISSMRIKPLPAVAMQAMIKGGARTIALAPEAGSERLRRVIRKNVTEDDIMKAMEMVAGEPVKQLKLYFMIGLPTETDNDIEEIGTLVLKCKDVLDNRRTNCRITLSVSPFVPKAGTPFQWLPMDDLDTLKRRFSRLTGMLTPKGIELKTESIPWSQVQGVLSRGDSRLAEAIAEIEEISLPAWRAAVNKAGLDIDSYLYNTWDVSEKLPWSIIDPGVKVRQPVLDMH